MRSFTLIELLIIVALIAVIGAFTLPSTVRFFSKMLLDKATETTIEALRRAQLQAVSQKNDSSFGIKLFPLSPTMFVIFQGDSYATRDVSQDEHFFVWAYVTLITGGIEEIVFIKETGTPSLAGTFYIALGSDMHGININSQGKIEKQ